MPDQEAPGQGAPRHEAADQQTPGQETADRETADREAPAQQDRPRRRQARGERRIAQLLEAAATVFCASGYTAAGTNAIAREAGVSPGTLYQFFPNKEAIAIELSGRLIHEMRETYSEAFAPVDVTAPLEETVGGIVDRFISFNCQHPVFFALMHGPDIPGRMTEEHDALHTALQTRVEELISSFLPAAPRAEVTRTAQMSFGLYKAGLELVLAHEGEERDAYVQELKAALVRYLAPMLGETSPGRTTTA
ncbi:TetR family transcriptional regulator [Streptomyces sp. NPDC059785]|uniref:TetR family transcriptional regulator n=1 Tax=unclassified Streptomyces TaxID=2593676 RepID=UPI0036555150